MFRTRALMATFILLAATGCQPSSPVDYPPLSFTQYQPIHMAVSNIQFIEEYKSPMQPPHVEHRIPYSPAEAMEIWIKDRLRAVGGDKTLQITLKDGSVKSTDLNKKTGIEGWFTVDQESRYDAKLIVEMRIYGDRPISEADITISASRSLTIPENASVSTRDGLYRKMIADLMEIANAQLEKNMFTYMANYISFSQNP